MSRRRRRNLCWLELWKTRLGCGKMKLNGLESTSGPWRCAGSIGSRLEGDVGGCRRRPGVAAGFR
jgi:hypothetical protein